MTVYVCEEVDQVYLFGGVMCVCVCTYGNTNGPLSIGVFTLWKGLATHTGILPFSLRARPSTRCPPFTIIQSEYSTLIYTAVAVLQLVRQPGRFPDR